MVRMAASVPGETRPYIVTVLAYKGGVGKTTIAYELAWLLDAVLVDLEWDSGSATRQWGYRHEDRVRAPLIDALERGRTPVPLQGFRKPLLVPGHPDLAALAVPGETITAAVETWAKEWGRPVVVDTHPGGFASTLGAAAAANVIVSPTVLATKELEALEGMLAEMADYPMVIVPNKVPPVPPAPQLEKLTRLVTAARATVAPPISHYVWLPRRQIRVAVTSYDPVPARIAGLDRELRAVADTVRNYVTV
jgi:chromosome partitioning protein